MVLASVQILLINLFTLLHSLKGLSIALSQVKHSNAIRKLKQELNDARATVEAKEQRIQKLHEDMIGKRSNWVMQFPGEYKASLTEQKHPLRRKESYERKFSRERENVKGEMAQKSQAGLESTRGRQRTRSDGSLDSLSSSTTRSLSPPSQSGKAYFGGRWTAYRADVRKVCM